MSDFRTWFELVNLFILIQNQEQIEQLKRIQLWFYLFENWTVFYETSHNFPLLEILDQRLDHLVILKL